MSKQTESKNPIIWNSIRTAAVQVKSLRQFVHLMINVLALDTENYEPALINGKALIYEYDCKRILQCRTWEVVIYNN